MEDLTSRSTAPDTRLRLLTARLPGWLLTATVVLPALAFWIVRSGDSTSVLYTDPKLFAFSVLGWTTFACLVVVLAPRWRKLRLSEVLSSTPIWVLSLFVSYCSLSLFWAWVPQRTLYELNQWMLLFLLTLALTAAQPILPNVAMTLRRAMIVAAALVTLGGAAQALGLFPWLLPISPQAGVSNPSFMGYKNPTAHLIAAQWFFLLFEARTAKAQHKSRRAFLLSVLLVGESLYLLTLLCRTAYVAWAGGAAMLVFFALLKIRTAAKNKRSLVRRTLPVFALLLVVCVGVFALPGVSQRIKTLQGVLENPDLAVSDRIVFWRNTVVMASVEPLGVGLGNWSVAYPLFREFARYRGFSTEQRVRDAHSDPIQFLGELGWLGLLLWLLLWIAAIRCAAQGGRESFYSRILLAQGACLFLLHIADFPLQHPYTRTFFWWWLCLVVLRDSSKPVQTAPAVSSKKCLAKNTRLLRAFALAACLLTATQLALHAGLFTDSLQAAKLETTMYRVRKYNTTPSPAEFAILKTAKKLGLETLPGPLNTLHPLSSLRWMTLAEACQRLGDWSCQTDAASWALITAPYEPIALRQLAAAIEKTDPQAAKEWNRLASFITAQATRGLPAGIDPREGGSGKGAMPPGHQ